MRLKLYHKTFITSFITTLLTLTVFTIILQSFTGYFLNNLADDQFNNAIRQVKEIKSSDDFTVERINEIEYSTQTSIRLYSASNELIYPRLGGGALTLVNGVQSVDAVTSDGKVRVATELLNIEGNIVIAMLSYNANMRTQEIQQIFINMIPMLVVIGLLMSLIISYVYAKSTVKKINQMNNTMTLMSTLEFDSNYQPEEGDELKDLENQIHYLYDKLIEEMEKIQNFERDRQVFMRGTIHELKTPIMIMEMQIRELIETDFLSEQQIEQVLNLQHRLTAMRELVSGGLDISKLESITELENVRVDQVTQEVVEYYESMLEDKNIKLIYYREEVEILMHEKHLSTILSNLLSNAIRYSSEDSEIRISIDEHSFMIENEFALEIENFENLDKPFVRGIDDNDGHGLGLYVVSNTLQKYQIEYDYRVKDHHFIFEFKLDG